ncbi:MAG TPA: hypothetical protein VJM69_05240, partial [Dehalococcoidia bacterium]|nr:hypothetical protein [Dehalococcoidia bacterium]
MAKGPPGPFEVGIEGGQPVQALDGRGVALTWTEAARARAYDVELDGSLVAEDLTSQHLEIKPGDGQLGFQDGMSSFRVRARNSAGERWSDVAELEVHTKGCIRARCFDHEDDGEISLATPSSGAALIVGPPFAFGDAGKGVALRCFDRANTLAYADHPQLPIEECWVRLAIRPESWEREDVPIHLARIRAESANTSEQIIWRTGRDIHSTSVSPGVPVPAGGWAQVQLGVLPDGAVELWAFDGRKEFLIGRGINKGLVGRGKDIVSLGNDSPEGGIPHEVWLDGFAFGEQRLPWARAKADHSLARPLRLDPGALPPVFSFVFGSDIRPTRAPYRGGALEAAAATEPDFLLNLGDYGYPDAHAYKQSKQGYLALWTDILYEEQVSRLFRKPWIYITSDHDLGVDNCDRRSLQPYASEAFAMWQNNAPSADGVGRYGSVELDGGQVLLVWVDTT